MLQNVTIRNLTADDIIACVMIISLNYNQEASEDFLQAVMSSYEDDVYNGYLVAVHGGTVVGVGGYGRTCIDDDIWGLFWGTVHPEYKNKGIGKLLLEERIRIIKEHGGDLILVSSNQQWHLERCGFKRLQEIGEYSLMSLAL